MLKTLQIVDSKYLDLSCSELTKHLDHYDRKLTFDDSTKYGSIASKKKPWEAAQYASKLEKDSFAKATGSLEAVRKCVALAKVLEVPVGSLVSSVLESKLFSDEHKQVLLSNAIDEENHYLAFNNLSKYIDCEHYLQEAYQLVEPLVNNEKHHPVFLSGFIELGLFFPSLALLRKFGDAPIKLLVNDVSKDESVHVRTNWSLIDDLGIANSSKLLENIRLDIINWMTSDLPKNTRFNSEFWVKTSNNLIETRQTDTLDFTKAGSYIAFFEVGNHNLAYYDKE